MNWEGGLILTAVVLVCLCIVGCCACCAVYRFAPENHLGAEYESSTKGERLIARGKASNSAGVLQVGPATQILKNQDATLVPENVPRSSRV